MFPPDSDFAKCYSKSLVSFQYCFQSQSADSAKRTAFVFSYFLDLPIIFTETWTCKKWLSICCKEKQWVRPISAHHACVVPAQNIATSLLENLMMALAAHERQRSYRSFPMFSELFINGINIVTLWPFKGNISSKWALPGSACVLKPHPHS